MDEDLYKDQLVDDSHAKKVSRLSEDVRNFNKFKNHFSKSTAEDSEFGVRDLECLMEVSKDGIGKKPHEHNNRSSSAVGSLGF